MLNCLLILNLIGCLMSFTTNLIIIKRQKNITNLINMEDVKND